jgi:hypothetical protein
VSWERHAGTLTSAAVYRCKTCWDADFCSSVPVQDMLGRWLLQQCTGARRRACSAVLQLKIPLPVWSKMRSGRRLLGFWRHSASAERTTPESTEDCTGCSHQRRPRGIPCSHCNEKNASLLREIAHGSHWGRRLENGLSSRQVVTFGGCRAVAGVTSTHYRRDIQRSCRLVDAFLSCWVENKGIVPVNRSFCLHHVFCSLFPAALCYCCRWSRPATQSVVTATSRHQHIPSRHP